MQSLPACRHCRQLGLSPTKSQSKLSAIAIEMEDILNCGHSTNNLPLHLPCLFLQFIHACGALMASFG